MINEALDQTEAKEGYDASCKLLLSQKVILARILKDYLPEFMVTNKNIYSILSKGIHELDEQECIDYFDTLFESIIMILDEILEKKATEAKQRTLTNKIAKIKGKFGDK